MARIAPGVGLVVAVVALLAVIFAANRGPPAPPPPSCTTDWRLCASDEEVANNWNGWTHLRRACETAATAKAKYGEPKWAHWPQNFGGYMNASIRPYMKEGKAVLLESDAQFQNKFGAWAHVRIECSYDLVQERVTDVSISEGR